MNVYADDAGEKRLVGKASVPADTGPVFEVPLFSAQSVIHETYIIGTVTHFRPCAAVPVAERAVLLAAGQSPDLLPGWTPLAS
ncbi:hypothetical protein [Falsiroseomonas sp. HW251]|uniref:hypothetical protein n=1 Tax=Falsiroseomonas sp. HW251 TaxID=3390998 RepID=UPI003D32420E